MSTDTFLARRVIELEEENRQQQDRIKWLTMTIASLSAGPVHEVSEAQFSMLVAEGPRQ